GAELMCCSIKNGKTRSQQHHQARQCKKRGRLHVDPVSDRVPHEQQDSSSPGEEKGVPAHRRPYADHCCAKAQAGQGDRQQKRCKVQRLFSPRLTARALQENAFQRITVWPFDLHFWPGCCSPMAADGRRKNVLRTSVSPCSCRGNISRDSRLRDFRTHG